MHVCIGMVRVLLWLVIRSLCTEVMEQVETYVKTSMSSTQVNTDSVGVFIYTVLVFQCNNTTKQTWVNIEKK